MSFVKNLFKIFGNEDKEKQPASEAQFGEYLSQITPTQKELEKQRLSDTQKREIEQVAREEIRFDSVVQGIKHEATAAAKLGNRKLRGVVTNTNRGFYTYRSEEDLQSIKANYDNDYRTSFYSHSVALRLKTILGKKLDAIGLKNNVTIQSGTHYYYMPKPTLSGRMRQERVYDYSKSNRYIICVEVSW